MGADSKIEWTDHTFNPWWGCQKVSPGCEHCYADTLAARFGHDIWGPPHATDRRTFGDKHWNDPVKWNRAAEVAKVSARVFCGSMCDVFEDAPQVAAERDRLLALIEVTPWLDWLLLTKRPQNVAGMTHRWDSGWPGNVWLGTSVEDQERADERIPALLDVAGPAVRFLSCEPLLGPVDLTWWLDRTGAAFPPLDWVIVGGESGPGARPMHPDWVRSLREQCLAGGAAFFFKQWGAWVPIISEHQGDHDGWVDEAGTYTHDTMTPSDHVGLAAPVQHVGKKAAGRMLDGRTWDEIPTPGLVAHHDIT